MKRQPSEDQGQVSQEEGAERAKSLGQVSRGLFKEQKRNHNDWRVVSSWGMVWGRLGGWPSEHGEEFELYSDHRWQLLGCL